MYQFISGDPLVLNYANSIAVHKINRAIGGTQPACPVFFRGNTFSRWTEYPLRPFYTPCKNPQCKGTTIPAAAAAKALAAAASPPPPSEPDPANEAEEEKEEEEKRSEAGEEKDVEMRDA